MRSVAPFAALREEEGQWDSVGSTGGDAAAQRPYRFNASTFPSFHFELTETSQRRYPTCSLF